MPDDPTLRAIIELEHALDEERKETRALRASLAARSREAGIRASQLRAVRQLLDGALALDGAAAVAPLACQALVRVLGWDAAAYVTVEGGWGLAAQAGLTAKQRSLLELHGPADAALKRAAAAADVFSTFHEGSSAAALGLRALLSTDDVAAAPVRIGGRVAGLLIVCAHTSHAAHHSAEDAEFLGSYAALMGSALQHGEALRSAEARECELRELDALKDSFLAITSHQLRTPLSIVKWIVSMLQSDRALDGMPEQRTLLDQAFVANERVIGVVNDLLSATRVQHGKLEYRAVPTDLSVLLHDLLEGTERVCEQAGLLLVRKLDDGLPLIPLDPLLVREALQNLVDNAVNYNEPGGSLHVSLRREGDEAVIEVQNTGFGLTAAELRGAFERFRRGDAAVRAHPNGSGLGLFLTRAIIERHGGAVGLVSQGGETCASVRLPLPV